MKKKQTWFEPIVSSRFMILMAMLDDNERYAPEVASRIEMLGGHIADGTLYTTLRRLEGHGLLRSRIDRSNRSGGRPPVFFRLTAKGIATARDARRLSLQMALAPDRSSA